MTFSMTEQEKCDFLIQVTEWAGLTVSYYLHNCLRDNLSWMQSDDNTSHNPMS